MPKEFLASPASLARTMHPRLETLRCELDRSEHYERASAELNELTLAFVLSAISQLGFRLEPGQRVSATAFMKSLEIPRICEPLLLRVIRFLQAEDVLRKSGDEWEVVSAPQIRPPEQQWRDLLHRRPGDIAELTLIHRYGTGLADLLRDHIDELDLLFPDDITTTIDHLFQDAPTSRIYNLLLQEALASACKDILDGRVVRILEVGSGCGRTGVNPQLLAIKSHRLIAFASKEAKGRRPLPGKNSTVEFLSVDLQADFPDQGLDNSTFDVVLLPDGLNIFHSQQPVLERIRRSLAPGGLLIMLEPTGLPAWMDLTLAPLLKLSAPCGLEADDSKAIITPESAAKLLIDAGFSDVDSVAEPVSKSDFTIFLARNNDSEPEEGLLTLPMTLGLKMIKNAARG